MRINNYNTIFMFFLRLKRLTGIKWAREQHLSLLPEVSYKKGVL